MSLLFNYCSNLYVVHCVMCHTSGESHSLMFDCVFGMARSQRFGPYHLLFPYFLAVRKTLEVCTVMGMAGILR